MNKEKFQRIYQAVMLVIITALITFSVTSLFLYKTGSIQYIPITSGDTTGLGTILTSFKNLLKEKYLYDLDEKKMVESAIKAYVGSAGDEYTEYFTKEEMESFSLQTSGNYVGVGVYMYGDPELDKIVISEVIKGGPAEKAGLQKGDIILKVDQVEYNSSQSSEMSKNIKGEAGTKVILEIKRNEEIKEYELIREKVELFPVEGVVLKDNVGYIKLESFDDGCAEQFKNAFNEIKTKNIKGLIIDLRNNGGGIVDEALSIADLILDKDAIALITRDKNQNEEIEKTKNDPIIELPIVVLVNKNTASASEILTGAIQDYKKGIVVGTQSYGKGVIQELYTLSDGSGLKITIKEYYTPNKNKIHKIGITPNYIIDQDEKTDLDEQLEKAIELLK